MADWKITNWLRPSLEVHDLVAWALGNERSNRGDVGLIRLSLGFVEPFVVEVSNPPRR
ncbi:hypothetical protein GEV33_002104 [Tenebrio molitor]|uniref:Uncharacterized protein n=1 Tax=Tenebrio molitor TaxID=7067 RepID=A0A8J6LJ43_TENMO|nr:hypothetical protein GEV33_002104 [Tenebrio molitor]